MVRLEQEASRALQPPAAVRPALPSSSVPMTHAALKLCTGLGFAARELKPKANPLLFGHAVSQDTGIQMWKASLCHGEDFRIKRALTLERVVGDISKVGR